MSAVEQNAAFICIVEPNHLICQTPGQVDNAFYGSYAS